MTTNNQNFERFSEHRIPVPANQADFVLGNPSGVGAAGGAAGDYLESLNLTITDNTQAAVSIKDGSGAAISVHPAGTIGKGIGGNPIYLGVASRTGAWKITTGTGVSVLATGNFK